MKYRLKCVLFGHRFIGWRVDEPREGLKTLVKMDYCTNCGLSKAEIGITT